MFQNRPFYISGLPYLILFVKLVHLYCFHFFLYRIKVCSVVPSGGTNCEMQSNTGVIRSLKYEKMSKSRPNVTQQYRDTLKYFVICQSSCSLIQV